MNNVSELRYNEEKMLARLSRQLQYLIQWQHKDGILYKIDLEDIYRFRESLQFIHNTEYMKEINQNQIVEVNNTSG